MTYLTAEERKAILTYQYHGGDSSPVYKYILSPIAQFCVDYFTPLWMAPNLITLSGLIISFLCAVLTAIYNPHLTTNGPRWLHALCGICILSYQTLDNMDGKQARRTGSSSALGMLFDHGCDAINAGVTAISMASVLGTGWTWRFFFTLWCAYVAFYFQTWEEYYLGAMILPPFNGPTEGLIMCSIACFFSAAYGSEWFNTAPIAVPSFLLIDSDLLAKYQLPTRSSPFITPINIALVVCLTATFANAVVQAVKVLSILSAKKQPISQPILDLLPFLVFFPSIIYYCVNSDVAFKMHPLVTLLLINAIFVEMAVHMMLMHICKGTIKPFQRYGAYVIPLLCVYITYKPATHTTVHEAWILFILTALFTAVTVNMIIRVCTEVAETLDIFVLRLGKRRTHTK